MPHPMKNKPAAVYLKYGKCLVTFSTLLPMSSRTSSVTAAETSSPSTSPAMDENLPSLT